MKAKTALRQRIYLGLAGLAVVGLSISAWVWLPSEGQSLRQQTTKLQQQIQRTEQETARLTGIEAILDARLPQRIELPTTLAQILSNIEQAGADSLRYQLGASRTEGIHAVQPSTVRFDSDTFALGRIFQQLHRQRPALALTNVEMERSDDGTVHTTLDLILVGNI